MTLLEATELQTFEIRDQGFPLLNFPVSYEQLVHIIEVAIAYDLTLQEATNHLMDIEIVENRVEKEKLAWSN